ncbi:MAG: CCA tRNA nucleotidyltransferase [Raoultibacter sp.]
MTHTKLISLPDYANRILTVLESAGFEAWCVGGFVRDAIRGEEAHDVDIATNARWEQSKKLFEAQGYKVYETGTKHGTISVSCAHEIVEITTYRTEGAYSDNRHPDEVFFTSRIEDDLARRDFTMNAIAYHPVRGFCDPYQGLKDIESQTIRAVGEPSIRFSEDALRILRACRFSSQLGFSVEAQTARAMIDKKSLLNQVSVERIAHELDGFFCGAHIHDALCNCVEIIGQIIPETRAMIDFDQRTPYHIYDVLEHTAYCMENCPQTSLVRWSAFFHDIGKPPAFFLDDEGVGHFYGHAKISVDIAQKYLKLFKMPHAFTHKALLLIKHHDDVIVPQNKAVKRALRRFDEDPDLFRALCALKKGDASAQAPQCKGRIALADELELVLDEILAENEVFSLKKLAINGNDILQLSVAPGPLVGTLLEAALDAVLDEEVPNEHDKLLAYVAKLIEKTSA